MSTSWSRFWTTSRAEVERDSRARLCWPERSSLLAVVATMLGLALAVVATRRFSGMTGMSWLDRASMAGGTLLSTTLTASALAFFGFILEIGVGCWDRLGQPHP